MKKQKKITKRGIRLIVTCSIAIAVALALIIINVFVPLKYIGAYIILGKDLPQENSMRVRFIDVDYGDSALVEFPDGKTMLIDGGADTYSNAHKLLKILNSSGIDKIDYLVCTSVKNEHCGGLAEILKYKRVGKAFIPYVQNKNMTDGYAEFYNQLNIHGIETEIAEYGKGVYSFMYGYVFYFLSPAVYSAPDSGYKNMNKSPTRENIDAASIVMWLEYSDNGFLFLSDASKEAQEIFTATLALENKKYVFDKMEFTLGDCALITAANHCGENSAYAPLYDLIRPESAIISVGENTYGSPSLVDFSTIQAYVGESLFRTDIDGTVTAVIKDGQFTVFKENR